MFRRAAVFVGQDSQGCKNWGDVPIEQPAKFKLVLNLNAATAYDLF
jgi:hypothetical protein